MEEQNNITSNRKRSFIAFDIPREIMDLCSRFQNQLQEYGIIGKWVKSDNQHITIYFLGDCTNDELNSIAKNISKLKINLEDLVFKIKNISSFGSPPKVLKVSLSDKNSMAKELVNEIIINNELPPPKHAWTPHLTLARLRNKKESNSLDNKILDSLDIKEYKFKPTNLKIYNSFLTNKGPKYKTFYNFLEE